MNVNYCMQPRAFAIFDDSSKIINKIQSRTLVENAPNQIDLRSNFNQFELNRRNSCPVQPFSLYHTQRRKFSPEEDITLSREIAIHGAKKWDQIALALPGRTGRQCRDRFHNYLKPSLTNGPWTREEDNLLYQKVNEIGQHWNMISKFFVGRSANNIKNRWYTYVMKQKQGQLKILPVKNMNKNCQQNGCEISDDNEVDDLQDKKCNNSKKNYIGNTMTNDSILKLNENVSANILAENVLDEKKIVNYDVYLLKQKNMNRILFPPIYPPNDSHISPSNLKMFDFLGHKI